MANPEKLKEKYVMANNN